MQHAYKSLQLDHRQLLICSAFIEAKQNIKWAAINLEQCSYYVTYKIYWVD